MNLQRNTVFPQRNTAIVNFVTNQGKGIKKLKKYKTGNQNLTVKEKQKRRNLNLTFVSFQFHYRRTITTISYCKVIELL
jgi:hypothetical protein